MLEMNGTVIRDTPIAVDFWQWRKCPSTKLFFLSHAHSDHTSGLSSTWRHPIYCSEVTGKIAVARCGVKHALIRALSVGEAHIIALDENGKETMTVTLIDANHCPGATMFLFEGYFGRFLYTGDFRYQPAMLHTPIFSTERPIDRLYLDNTYNCPESNFPSEIDCKVKIMEILSKYPYYYIVLGLHQLGKENLLVDIATFFDEKIQVSPDRLALIEVIDCKAVFTTEECRIRVEPVHTISISAVDQWNADFPTIVIIPSAIFQSQRKSCLTSHPCVFTIPYSSHSSYSELMSFVKQVKPRRVIPIVKPPAAKEKESVTADVSNFNPCLNPTLPTAFQVPPSVKEYMQSSSTLCVAGKSSLKKVPSVRGRRRAPGQTAKGVVFMDVPSSDAEERVRVDSGSSPNSSRKCDPNRTHREDCKEQDGQDFVSVSERAHEHSGPQKSAKENGSTDTQSQILPRSDDRDEVKSTESEQVTWQICPESFYVSPYKKSLPKKRSSHVCDHAEAGKSCLCKYLAIKDAKKVKLNAAQFGSKDSEQVKDEDNSESNKMQEYVSEKADRTSASDTDSHSASFNRTCGKPPADDGDYRLKCYGAIQRFYARMNGHLHIR